MNIIILWSLAYLILVWFWFYGDYTSLHLVNGENAATNEEILISVMSFVLIWCAMLGFAIWVESIDNKLDTIDKKLDIFVKNTLELVKKYGNNRKK